MDRQMEHAVKSIFLECIKDPQIMESLKDGLSGDGDAGGIIRTSGNDRFIQIGDKLDQLLKKQNDMMLLLESGGNQGNDKAIPFFSKRVGKDQNDEIVSLKKDYENLERTVKELRMELEKEITEKEAWKKEEQRRLEKIQAAREGLEIWEKVKLLSKDSKRYIYQLCGSDEFYALVSLGRDGQKIAQLWNYLRDQAVLYEEHEQDVKIINDFFEFCIHVANEINEKEDRYSFYETDIGGVYDMESCIKTCNSRQIGNIARIIVRGVKQKEKIKFKSIVQTD